MAVQLSPQTLERLERLAARDGYENVDDFVESLLDEDEAHDEQLRTALQAGLDSIEAGRVYLFNDTYWEEMRARAAEADRRGDPLKPDVLP